MLHELRGFEGFDDQPEFSVSTDEVVTASEPDDRAQVIAGSF